VQPTVRPTIQQSTQQVAIQQDNVSKVSFVDTDFGLFFPNTEKEETTGVVAKEKEARGMLGAVSGVSSSVSVADLSAISPSSESESQSLSFASSSTGMTGISSSINDARDSAPQGSKQTTLSASEGRLKALIAAALSGSEKRSDTKT
jgi:hypothetical protein